MPRRRVLAIEHDWRMRKLIRANLEAFGLEVRVAVNGGHGLHLLGQDKPDVILLDADLPDMETSLLIDHLQAELAGQVPIIVLSAEPPDRNLKENGLAFSYLLKPFAAPALLQHVGQALGGIAGDRAETITAR